MSFSIKKIDITKSSAEWNNFFLDFPDEEISLAANPSFATIFSIYFNIDPTYYFIIEEGSVIGVLPGFLKNGRFLSMPMLSSGGAFIKKSSITKEAIYRELSLKIHPLYEIREFKQYSSYSNQEKVTCYKNLCSTVDEQLNSFKSKLRSQILKGYKNGLTTSVGGSNFLPDFYKLYSKNLHRLGTPVPSINYFYTFINNYKYGTCAVFSVKKDNTTIATAITFSYCSFFEVMWASTDRKYNYLNPNMLLYWEMMKYSIEKKMHIFSFGRSAKESATLTFKRQWEITEHTLYFNMDTPHYTSTIKKYISFAWKHLPYKLTLFLGPILRTNFIN